MTIKSTRNFYLIDYNFCKFTYKFFKSVLKFSLNYSESKKIIPNFFFRLFHNCLKINPKCLKILQNFLNGTFSLFFFGSKLQTICNSSKISLWFLLKFLRLSLNFLRIFQVSLQSSRNFPEMFTKFSDSLNFFLVFL